jgi:tRNA A-37 threonylcarbamoyl transferase component Bud32
VAKCPTCGKHLDDTARFCPDDGTPLPDVGTGVSERNGSLDALVLPVLIGGRYRLEQVRGGGGMAVVYEAVDITLERRVAVKLLHPALRQDPQFDTRFQREARIASQLADPHIIVVHDFGIDIDHGPYLVMEYLQGQSLREHLQTLGTLPIHTALDLASQLLLAMIHAHAKGFIHRDLKPDNVFLLNQAGLRLHVRVLDFGIARIYHAEEALEAATLTRTGAILGTPRYMAPEQLAGHPADVRADLYSFALIMHEALTGTLPYVTTKRLVELRPDVPAELQRVLEECLRQDPEERPARAIDVYLRLRDSSETSGTAGSVSGNASTGKQGTQTGDVAPSDARARRARRRMLVTTTVGVVLLAAGGLAAVGLKGLPISVVGRESVLGLEVGQNRDDVVARFHRPKEKWAGDPWQPESIQAIGQVLRPEDLPAPGKYDDVEVIGWPREGVCVVLRDNQIAAAIIRASGASTRRHLKVGAKVNEVLRLYPEVPSIEVRMPGEGAEHHGSLPTHVEIFRYDQLGIGFEVRAGIVESITLYPASQN